MNAPAQRPEPTARQRQAERRRVAAAAGAVMRQWPLPDFAPAPRRSPWWAWLLCASGLLAAACTGWQAWDQHQQTTDLAAQAAAWQARVQPGAAPNAPRRATPTTAAEAASAARASAAARQVAQAVSHRWDRLLRAVEQHGVPQVQWLRLVHEAQRPEVLLEAQVPDRQTALALVSRLATAPGWQQVSLQRSDEPDPASGRSGLRIEIAARLDGDAAAALEAGAAP